MTLDVAGKAVTCPSGMGAAHSALTRQGVFLPSLSDPWVSGPPPPSAAPSGISLSVVLFSWPQALVRKGHLVQSRSYHDPGNISHRGKRTLVVRPDGQSNLFP